ncbi:MAG: hypothetical protein MUE51_01470 [Thermoleophilia bacterium]|jgi:uncharacterized integral membrane protein|nr:hypothetical protein [Thermoleophilia bacterium]
MSTGPPAPQGGRPPGGGLDERQVRQLGLIVVIVVVAILVLAFIVENTDRVELSFVFFSARTSLIWVILLALVAGIVIGAAGVYLLRRRFASAPKDR